MLSASAFRSGNLCFWTPPSFEMPYDTTLTIRSQASRRLYFRRCYKIQNKAKTRPWDAIRDDAHNWTRTVATLTEHYQKLADELQDAIRHDAVKPTPSVATQTYVSEQTKYEPRDAVRHDPCKPTPSVATQTYVSEQTKYEPRGAMRHDPCKPTPSVAKPSYLSNSLFKSNHDIGRCTTWDTGSIIK
jgi:hypothetical protein